MTQASPAPGIRRPTGLRAERKRRAIIAAAREIFMRHGYDAGVELIADAAGVSKVTIYNHFGSKEQLFTEVISEAFDQALGGAAEPSLDGLAGTEDLRRALLAAARGWVAGITRPEVTDLRLLVIGVARRFPELARKWLEQSPQRFAPVIAAALRELSRRGDLDVPSPDLAGHPVLRADRLPAHRPLHVRDQPGQTRHQGPAYQRRRDVPQLLQAKDRRRRRPAPDCLAAHR